MSYNKLVFIFMNERLVKIFENHRVTNFVRHEYQFVVDSLMYAMLETRSNIVFVVFVVNRYVVNSIEQHWKIVKRIFRYLKEIIDLSLIYKDTIQKLINYTDANWEKDHDTHRFTSNFVFNIDSDAINWQFKRQFTVTLFSCEIEYMSQTQVIKEAIWLTSLLNQLNYTSFDKSLAYVTHTYRSIIIRCDNQNVIALIKNSQNHARTKHIDLQWHYQREKINDDFIKFEYVFTHDQIVDDLIKTLSEDKFRPFRLALSLKWSILFSFFIWYKRFLRF
jgi:hypothetical protein